MMNRFIIYLLLLVPCFVFSQKREKIFTANAAAPIGPYSQAIKAGNTLYVSGQIALKPDGSMDTVAVENEVDRIFLNLKAILNAAKMDLNNVVKSTIYLTDLKNFKKVNEVYGKYFSEIAPARETVEVKALPKGAHVEISVIATH